MRATMALIRREFLEHRGSFLYAPGVLLGVLTLAVLYGLLTGGTEFETAPLQLSGARQIFELALASTFGLWGIYLGIALFFYFADSFSADRRNNALLFWKSMPQSDLNVLASKALSAITVFFGLIAGFALVTAVLVYLGMLIGSAQLSFLAAPGPAEALWSYVQVSAIGILYMFLSVLWSAPFLAWVAGLSTLFQRWSIPLAILVPGAVVLLEYLNSLRSGGGRPIADYLGWRLQGIADEGDVYRSLIGPESGGPGQLLEAIVSGIDWPQMGLGLLFAAVVVYLASEYRRRRIEA